MMQLWWIIILQVCPLHDCCHNIPPEKTYFIEGLWNIAPLHAWGWLVWLLTTLCTSFSDLCIWVFLGSAWHLFDSCPSYDSSARNRKNDIHPIRWERQSTALENSISDLRNVSTHHRGVKRTKGIPHRKKLSKKSANNQFGLSMLRGSI